MSRSPWAWTKGSAGDRARAISSLIAMDRAATAVMLLLALFPAGALGKVGKAHRRGSAASIAQASRIARAAHSNSHNSGPPHAAKPAHHASSSSRGLLALGTGYSAPHGSKAVKVLQRRLVAVGFPPGPIDGRYGPLTQHAVIKFQAGHGVQADGIVGPVTQRALARAEPVLRPGAGYVRGGSPLVRRLQRNLAAAGYSPGPVDGRYGPGTERAVLRLQQARNLSADGIAGPQTDHQLRAILARRGNPHPTSLGLRSSTRRHRRRSSTHPSQASAPTGPATSQPARGTLSDGSPSILWIVALVGLLTATLAGALWRRQRGREDQPPEATATADAEPGPADKRAFRIAAFRRADERGHAVGSYNLGTLLEEEGDLRGAIDAYRRADERDDANGAFRLGVLLEQTGDLPGAEAAYRRAERRGEPRASCNLGLLLKHVGDNAGALRALRRADRNGPAEVIQVARAALLELDPAEARDPDADQRQDRPAASEPDPARPAGKAGRPT